MVMAPASLRLDPEFEGEAKLRLDAKFWLERGSGKRARLRLDPECEARLWLDPGFEEDTKLRLGVMFWLEGGRLLRVSGGGWYSICDSMVVNGGGAAWSGTGLGTCGTFGQQA